MKVTIFFGTSLYTNRIVLQSLADTAGGVSHQDFENINFIEGDGIETTLTLNINATRSPTYLEVWSDDETEPVEQYWWVIGAVKERKGQLTLSLRRDFIREFQDDILQRPFLCEKAATIPEDISYAKYAKSMNLSQIKKKEILLTDREGAKGWLYIYLSRDSSGKSLFLGKTLEDGTYSITFPSSGLQRTLTTPYDIIAMPILGSYTAGTIACDLTVTSARQISMLFASAFGDSVLDTQWLPYGLGHINGAIQSPYDPIPIMEGTSTKGALFVLEDDMFTRTIQSSSIADLSALQEDLSGLTNLQARIYNEEHYFRLVSPNYASQFEFNPIRNNGELTEFRIEVGLKPYTPYIYIWPLFSSSGLYGGNFNDGRGLILSGDFSLDRASNAWANYELNNKNYELIFNRQIQSLDLQNTYHEQLATQSEVKSILGGIGGTVGGILGGMKTGSKLGPAGTIAGGVIGGVAGLGTGIYSAVTTFQNKASEQAIRDDSRQATIDQFQYQLGNIQASPNTLTKISAINPGFKIYPILEVYECTDQEKRNLLNSIIWNGIDINIVTALEEFDYGFIKGSLLEFNSNIGLNDQQCRAMNAELQYGIYLYKREEVSS